MWGAELTVRVRRRVLPATTCVSFFDAGNDPRVSPMENVHFVNEITLRDGRVTCSWRHRLPSAEKLIGKERNDR